MTVGRVAGTGFVEWDNDLEVEVAATVALEVPSPVSNVRAIRPLSPPAMVCASCGADNPDRWARIGPALRWVCARCGRGRRAR